MTFKTLINYLATLEKENAKGYFCIAPYDNVFICFGAETTDIDLAPDSKKKFVKLQLKDDDMCQLDAQGFDEAEDIFEDVDFKLLKRKLSIAHNRLEALSPQLSAFASNVSELDFSNNCMKTIDEGVLKSFSGLTALRMVNSIQPDIELSLGFLASLTKLQVLAMTLPHIEVDFEIFASSLSQLQELELRSVVSLDATKKRQELTKKDFNRLASLKHLQSLALTHFQLDSIDESTLSGFKQLTSIDMSNNCVQQPTARERFQEALA